MKTFRTGLVVGKFAPFHRGHQWLLDEADRACDRLVVLSYSVPELPGCDPSRRERWLRALYPHAMVRVLDDARLGEWCDANHHPRTTLPGNDASDDVHRRFVGWLLRTVIGADVDAVFTSEAYGDGFARALSEMQSGRLPVVHVEVDRGRARIPVSGTSIRRDVHAHRSFLDPVVYADFVERIAIIGGESTGKTTLAQALAERLESRWVPEYGRALWEARGGRLEFADMLDIAVEQVAREDAAARECGRFLVCDTTPLTTMLYSDLMFGNVDPTLADLASRPYDHVFLCDSDFGFVQDGTRSDAHFQARQQQWYLTQLNRRGLAYHRLGGSVEARLQRVLGLIGH